jgi:hypothetical protein
MGRQDFQVGISNEMIKDERSNASFPYYVHGRYQVFVRPCFIRRSGSALLYGSSQATRNNRHVCASARPAGIGKLLLTKKDTARYLPLRLGVGPAFQEPSD